MSFKRCDWNIQGKTLHAKLLSLPTWHRFRNVRRWGLRFEFLYNSHSKHQCPHAVQKMESNHSNVLVSQIYISLMRALTRTVLRPWKQHGGHLLPLLGPQRGQNKESQHSEDWSYGKAATFISNSHLPMMASCDSNPTNKHLIQVDPNLLLLDISSFFFSFLFFFFTCFREKNKKQQRDCFTHWLATM